MIIRTTWVLAVICSLRKIAPNSPDPGGDSISKMGHLGRGRSRTPKIVLCATLLYRFRVVNFGQGWSRVPKNDDFGSPNATVLCRFGPSAPGRRGSSLGKSAPVQRWARNPSIWGQKRGESIQNCGRKTRPEYGSEFITAYEYGQKSAEKTR